MKNDTRLGGPRRAFPDTTGGFLSQLRGPGTRPRAASLETLCRRYWKPVYTYIRLARSKTNEDAKDLTQAFFAWLMEGERLERYDAARGSFRNYLKLLLTSYLNRHERDRHRIKRGGALRIVPLEGLDDESLPGDTSQRPDEAFEQQWVRTLVENAFEQVSREFTLKQRSRAVEIYTAMDRSSPDERPTQRDIARRFGVTGAAVRHALEDVRSAMRHALISELRELTDGEESLREEWGVLFGA